MLKHNTPVHQAGLPEFVSAQAEMLGPQTVMGRNIARNQALHLVLAKLVDGYAPDNGSHSIVAEPLHGMLRHYTVSRRELQAPDGSPRATFFTVTRTQRPDSDAEAESVYGLRTFYVAGRQTYPNEGSELERSMDSVSGYGLCAVVRRRVTERRIARRLTELELLTTEALLAAQDAALNPQL